MAENNKMKYFDTSALTGDNIDKMFYTVVEDIIELQQSKKKKIVEDYLDAPVTYDNLRHNQNEPKTDRKQQ